MLPGPDSYLNKQWVENGFGGPDGTQKALSKTLGVIVRFVGYRV
jgi:hypothetical protein